MANPNLVTEYSTIVRPFEVEVVGKGTNLQKELCKRQRDRWRLVAAVPTYFEQPKYHNEPLALKVIVLFWERLSPIEEEQNEIQL